MTQDNAIENTDELQRLQQIVADLLAEAKQQGATAAEAGVSNDYPLPFVSARSKPSIAPTTTAWESRTISASVRDPRTPRT